MEVWGDCFWPEACRTELSVGGPLLISSPRLKTFLDIYPLRLYRRISQEPLIFEKREPLTGLTANWKNFWANFTRSTPCNKQQRGWMSMVWSRKPVVSPLAALPSCQGLSVAVLVGFYGIVIMHVRRIRTFRLSKTLSTDPSILICDLIVYPLG